MTARLRVDPRAGKDAPGWPYLLPIPVIDADSDRVVVEARPWPVRAVCVPAAGRWTVTVQVQGQQRTIRTRSVGAAILAAVRLVRREGLLVSLSCMASN